MIATAGAGLVLIVSILASSPQLHRWLHPDAGRADHECVITLFQHGVTEVGVDGPVVAAALLVVAGQTMAPTAPDLVAPRFRLSPGRAPPGC